jgi:DNA invertase Pin-like site-specific DNA recombinase
MTITSSSVSKRSSCASQRRSDVEQRATLPNPGFGARIDNSRRTGRQRAAVAVRKSWKVLDEHIYVDEAVSGAATLARLKAKARLFEAVATKPAPFDVLIAQAADRLSRRDGVEAVQELRVLAKAGIAVHYYSDGTAFAYGDFASNTLSFLRA